MEDKDADHYATFTALGHTKFGKLILIGKRSFSFGREVRVIINRFRRHGFDASNVIIKEPLIIVYLQTFILTKKL